ncbi:MAG: LON peptidase substrate-binding domain-containing protein [Actinomycetota bacterium]
MFPLGQPVLPGGLLPLRIFEPRYLALLRHCLQMESPEFGVVLIERGFEVGGGDYRTMFGTAVGLVEALPRPTGDVAVVGIGRRRLRVVEWLPDEPHPWALVEDWPDSESDVGDDLTALVATTLDRLRRLADLSGLPDRHHEAIERLATAAEVLDASDLSFALAASAGFGAADQQRLLCCKGALDRLRTMQDLLDDLEAVVRFQLGEGT